MHYHWHMTCCACTVQTIHDNCDAVCSDTDTVTGIRGKAHPDCDLIVGRHRCTQGQQMNSPPRAGRSCAAHAPASSERCNCRSNACSVTVTVTSRRAPGPVLPLPLDSPALGGDKNWQLIAAATYNCNCDCRRVAAVFS